MQMQDYEAVLAEFNLSPEDALFYECVTLECVGEELVYDTVPGALSEYFKDEGGWVH